MKTLVGAVALGAALLAATPAQATTITFFFGTAFSNSTTPEGPGPWMKGTLDDSVGNGDLLLTLNTDGLTGTEFIDAAYFNLNTAYDPNGLNVAVNSDTTGGSFTGASTGLNAFQADGDGKYDLLLEFRQSPPRFSADQTISFLLSHDTQNLVLADLAFLSQPAGGSGPYLCSGTCAEYQPCGWAGWQHVDCDQREPHAV